MRSAEYNGARNFERLRIAQDWYNETIEEMATMSEFSDEDIERYHNLSNYLIRNGFVKMWSHLMSLLAD